MANARLGVCARKWKRPSEHFGASFRTHMSKCLKGSKAKKTRLAPAVRHATTCARECNQKVKNRVKHGDRTDKKVMKSVCMRKCAERPKASAPLAAAPAPIKRDVTKLCAKYSSDANTRARCVAGEVGPGLLLSKLAGRSPSATFSRTPAYRLAKRMKKALAKRKGLIRRAALKMKRGNTHRFVMRSPFGTGRKTIGRRR